MDREEFLKKSRELNELRQELKQQFENLVDQYLTLFCEKQGIEKKSNYWVGGCVGELIDINDAVISFDNIKIDIDTNQPKGNIFSWYWENEELNNKSINYYSYTKGLRVKDLK